MNQLAASPNAASGQPNPANWEPTDFLSGLVTHDNAMIALIDLPNLLTAQIDSSTSAKSEPKFPSNADR